MGDAYSSRFHSMSTYLPAISQESPANLPSVSLQSPKLELPNQTQTFRIPTETIKMDRKRDRNITENYDDDKVLVSKPLI